MLQHDGASQGLEQMAAELESLNGFQGLLPGARILFDVEFCPGGDWQQPVNSWVLYDDSDKKWFVWRALVIPPDSHIRIFYHYKLEEEYPEIGLMSVQYATFREYKALFKVIHALRQISAKPPGPAPDPVYNLAASMVASGSKSYKDVLEMMFGEDDREAARQGLRRRLKD